LCGTDESYIQEITISILPDDVLLEIFDSCLKATYDRDRKWHLLGHVCRRWRQIVFASPQRLNLRILCTQRTPVKTGLAIWPAYPLTIYSNLGILGDSDGNIIAALEHKDRVYSVRLTIRCWQLGRIAVVMREPFPLLTDLDIFVSTDRIQVRPALPVAFLGGSAPRLRSIILSGVHYPTTPTFLFSTSDLITLRLYRIPPTSNISPEAMIGCLAVLSRLETFVIEFQSAVTPLPLLDQITPVTQAVLPALTTFGFRGTSEYLERLVSRINSPQLDRIYINFLNWPDGFQAAQLSRFIDRSLEMLSPVFKRAEVTFSSGRATFAMSRPGASAIIRWEWMSSQTSHLPQALSQIKISGVLFNVVHLKLDVDPGRGRQLEGTFDVQWQHFFRQLSNVKTLHVSRKLARQMTPALEDIAGWIGAEVLPSLDLIWMGGQRASSLQKFIASRRLSDHRVTVVSKLAEFNKRLESYVGE
jgi:hypothetical protein